MRPLLVVTLLLAAGLPTDLTAQAVATVQTPAPAAVVRTPDGTQPWDKIQGLMAGTKLHIKFKNGHKAECRVVTVTPDAVNCDSTASFKRVDIDSIRSNHRIRSTVVGLVTGYFGAGLIGAAAASGNRCSSWGCAITLAVVALTTVIVVPIVFHIMDLTATTLYKAP